MRLLRWGLTYFVVISRLILLRMWNVLHTNYRENQNKCFMFRNFCSENRAVYEMLWKNIVQPDRPQMPVEYDAEKQWFACQITAESIQICTYRVNLIALSRQQCLPNVPLCAVLRTLLVVLDLTRRGRLRGIKHIPLDLSDTSSRYLPVGCVFYLTKYEERTGQVDSWENGKSRTMDIDAPVLFGQIFCKYK